MTYDINGKQGRKEKIDEVSIFSVTASGSVTLIPTVLGRRDYIKIVNNGAADVKLYSTTASGSVGLLIPNAGTSFEDLTNAPLYIVSTGADSIVSIYERNNK